MSRILLLLYLALSLLNLYAEQTRAEVLIFVTKPLLLTLLSLWFYLQLRPLRERHIRLIQAGLIFSIGGDVLLMLVSNGPKNEDFFLLGLGSFLVAQICYLSGFSFFPGARRGIVVRRPWRAWPFFLYLVGIMGALWTHIPGPMKLPVGVYSLAIVSMAVAAFNLRPLLSREVFMGLLAGVLLFVLSDSIIALNKFMGEAVPIPAPRLSIMFTYLLGQFLIAWNVVRAEQKRREEG